MRLRHLIPCSWEILVLMDCRTSRFLVYTMVLYGRVIPSSKQIHKRLYGNHICGSDIIRVIYSAPSHRRYRLGVSHSMKLNPSIWNPGG
jgi:hypothetical protein